MSFSESFKNWIVRILRWSEKYTQTDMVYLASGGFWLIAYQVTAALVSFGLAVAFAHLVDPDTYGIYKYLLIILGLLTLACLRGMDAVVIQASARGNDSTVLQAFFTKVRWGFLGVATSIVFAVYYAAHRNTMMAFSFVVACLFIPIMDPLGLYSSVFTGKRAFKTQAVIDGFGQIATAAVLVITLLYFKNPIALFAAYGFSWTVARLVGFVLALRQYPPNGKFEPRAMSYGWHSSLNNSMAVLIASLDSILVFHYLGAAKLAVYTFAMAPVIQSKTLTNVITTLATPKFAAQNSAVIRETIFRRSWMLFVIGIGFAFAYSAVAPFLFQIFFPRYIEAIPYSQVFSVTIALSLGVALLNGILNARITLIPKWQLYLWNTPAIVLGIVSILFIKNLGIWGAIMGQVLSSVTSFLIGWILYRSIRNRDFTPHAGV